ncbi:MAG: efflux RND transporter permease subunit, partial [Candidatus Cloacimonetes bacterium]|nr:efflux RND transporter permease subunit [Candidatus Cloacimonadota bacterium]
MKIAQAAVNRPVLTSMVSLIVIILGAVALSRLPIDLMPDVTSPTISISTSYSKASPLTMEELVTRPIEEAVAAVPGVQEISSRSTEGNSNVQVRFSWGTDLEAASNDIRDRIDRIISRLPSEAGRPSLRKFDMAATPVIMMGVTSQLEALELRRILEEQVSYRLERVNGVASVNIWGGRTREIHINLDPARMNALKVPLDQVISRIRSANVNQPAGNVYRGNHQITVRVPGLYENLDELRNTVIMRRGGSTIALRDIAEVIDTASKETRIVRINGEAGIQISVNKQSGTNTVKVVQGILEEVEQINRSIPQIKVVPLMDSSVFIKQSINNVSMSALLGGILAVLILLFFLRNLTSTLVISTAIPISIMATFGLLYFNGFTLNLMTIGALALGVGQLLDNSIVVMENIFRHREMGKSSQLAAVDGSMEVGSPILASTLTSIVVFLPLLFMRGMSGIMFQQLAFVVVFALICSLITAITLVPMLSGKIIKVTQEPPLNAKGFSIRIYHGVGSILRKVENWYQMLLCKALNHRAQTLVIVLVMLAGAAFLASVIDSELMPISDEGEILISIDMEAGTQLELVDAKMLMAEERIKDIPEITNIVATAGGGGWGSSNTGSLRISLLSKSERERSDEEIAADMRDKLANIPGARVRVRTVSNNRMTRVMGGGGGRIEIQVRGHEMDEAYRLASIIVKNVESVEGITDVNLSRTAGAPEDLVQIDRQKAAELGLSVQQISSTLETVLSGTKAGDYMD